MFIHRAYLNNQLEAFVDTQNPLTVSSCGMFHLTTRPQFETNRPQGRPDYQLLYVAAGKALFFLDGQARTLNAGSVVLYRPGETQRYIYYGADQPQVYWLHFTGFDVQALLQRHGLWDQTAFYAGTSAEFPRLFDSIIRELQLSRPLYRQILPGLLRHLLLLLQRQLLEPPAPGKTVEGEIQEAVEYFQKNYNQPIAVAEYASAHHMSSAWFIHEFKRCAGAPPMQYILTLRLNNARGLMAETDYTISEIAAIVGFSDPLYFSRQFKKRFGLSPTQYRKFLHPQK